MLPTLGKVSLKEYTNITKLIKIIIKKYALPNDLATKVAIIHHKLKKDKII
jgi:hypothetical protein